MKRVLLPLAWLLLAAAAPVPVRLTPERPVLGVPILLTAELPEGCELAGLPPLAPFELLEPPRRDGAILRLVLLPMRPGAQIVPSLPLRQGGRQLSTAEIPVTIAEGVPAGAGPAPLKSLPPAAGLSVRWVVPALLLALAAAAGGWWLLRRRAPRPPRLEELTGEALLAELQRRLEAVADISDDTKHGLAQRLERLRFAPLPPDAAEIEELRAKILALAEASA